MRRRRQARAAGSSLAAVATLVTLYELYPIVRGLRIVAAAVAVKVVSLAVILYAGTLGVLRWHLPAREDRAAWATAWLLVVSSIASAAGPWARGRPVQEWGLAPYVSIPTWLLIGGVNAWMLCRVTASRSSSSSG